jgi:hypothetical protein
MITWYLTFVLITSSGERIKLDIPEPYSDRNDCAMEIARLAFKHQPNGFDATCQPIKK